MTWRHPSITYGAVEPEATSPPPGRRRAAGWAATIIGVGLECGSGRHAASPAILLARARSQLAKSSRPRAGAMKSRAESTGDDCKTSLSRARCCLTQVAQVETRFPNILLEGGALSMVENPIRTCSPYPSPGGQQQSNPAPRRRADGDVRVVDLVLPINLPLRAASEALRIRARETP